MALSICQNRTSHFDNEIGVFPENHLLPALFLARYFQLMVKFSLQRKGSGRPVQTNGKRPWLLHNFNQFLFLDRDEQNFMKSRSLIEMSIRMAKNVFCKKEGIFSD